MMLHILWLLASVMLAIGAESPCDGDLLRQVNRNDADRYQPRGNDRCEGVYLDPVSNNGRLWIASLTSGAMPPAKWQGPLQLQWNGYRSAGVTLQAYSLRPRFYYRLDSARPAGVDRFGWPTDMVAKYLPPHEVGLVAFTTATVDGRQSRVYLPLGQSARPATPYQLTMVSTADLSEVSVSISPVGGKPLQVQQKLPLGRIVKGQPFLVPLPSFPKPGVYRVDVIGQADRSADSVMAPPLLIYHAGEAVTGRK